MEKYLIIDYDNCPFKLSDDVDYLIEIINLEGYAYSFFDENSDNWGIEHEEPLLIGPIIRLIIAPDLFILDNLTNRAKRIFYLDGWE